MKSEAWDNPSPQLQWRRPGKTKRLPFSSPAAAPVPPRGALYTHGNFTAQVESIRNTYHIEPGEIDLPTFPLFALFGPALGMAIVIPDMDPTRPALVDPRKIIEAIEDFGITNMFGSPALINRVGRYGHKRGIKLPTLRRVIAAGAPMPPAVLERFCTMLSPEAQVHTGYGATEAMPVSSIGSHEILNDTRYGTDSGNGVCVGKPVGGMQVAVVPISDGPHFVMERFPEAPVRRSGRDRRQRSRGHPFLIIRTTWGTVCPRFTNPTETVSGIAWGIWGRWMNRDGYGFFGRKSHRVVTPLKTYFAIACEGVFNTHQAVFRTALTEVKIGGRVNPVLCVELEAQAKHADLDTLKRELLELGARFPHTEAIKIILFHPKFPVDIRHNAKIYRERLGLWASRKLAKERKTLKP